VGMRVASCLVSRFVCFFGLVRCCRWLMVRVSSVLVLLCASVVVCVSVVVMFESSVVFSLGSRWWVRICRYFLLVLLSVVVISV